MLTIVQVPLSFFIAPCGNKRESPTAGVTPTHVSSITPLQILILVADSSPVLWYEEIGILTYHYWSIWKELQEIGGFSQSEKYWLLALSWLQATVERGWVNIVVNFLDMCTSIPHCVCVCMCVRLGLFNAVLCDISVWGWYMRGSACAPGFLLPLKPSRVCQILVFPQLPNFPLNRWQK